MSFKDKKIVVTGAAGDIAGAVIAELTGQKANIFCMHRGTGPGGG